LLNADEERWRCRVCDPKPLLFLIEQCTAVMEALARNKKPSATAVLDKTKKRRAKVSTKNIKQQLSSNCVRVTETQADMIDNLLQATFAMSIFLQNCYKTYDNTEIADKLINVHSKYGVLFRKCFLSCQEISSPPTYIKNARPVAAAGPSGLTCPGANHGSMGNANSIVQPSGMNVQPGWSVLNESVLSRNSASGKVVEISDSDDKKNTNIRSSTSSSGAVQTTLERTQQLNRVAVVQSDKSGSTQGVKAVTVAVSGNVTRKRSRSPEKSTTANDQSHKRIRL